MTKPQSADSASSPSPEAAAEDTTATVQAAPPPEPWTPERVTAWNRYLDRYVAGGVLLLVLLAAIHPIEHVSIWVDLRAGELVARSGPPTTDPFSYTEAGKPWANVSWLFQAVNWQVYQLGQTLFRANPERADHASAGFMIALNALVMLACAAVLLSVRRRGPGLWWASVCVMIALGGSIIPTVGGLIVAIGGLAGRPKVDSAIWGLLWLSIEVLLLVRAYNQGKPLALWGLPIVFLLWANSDLSFGFGLIVLLAWTAGGLLARRTVTDPEPGPSVATGLGALAACVAVCLLNPSLWRAFGPAFEPYYDVLNNMLGWSKGPLTQDRLGLLDPRSWNYLSDIGLLRLQIGYTLVMVGLGLLSFALNRSRFRLGRLLAFLSASLVWAALMTMGLFFAAILAMVLALNGQEWYLDRFGAEGRVGTGWKLWSDGGRSVTILILFGFLATTITGFAANPLEPSFGFGVDDRSFAFDEAEALRESGVEGHVFNLLLSQGDALIWKAPKHKTFLDSRKGVFPDSLRIKHQQIKEALAKGDRQAWGRMLDEYGVTVVMVSPRENRKVYDALRRSPFWVPFHDGGLAVLFGRVDKETKDQAVFLDLRLDAEKLAYGRNDALPDPIRVPTPTGLLDRAFRSRVMDGPPPPVQAGQRWLADPVTGPPADQIAGPPSPARALLAIREARKALAKDADDPYAYGLLQAAYSVLQSAEVDILSRAEAKKQENRPLSGSGLRRPVSPLVLEMMAPMTAPQNWYDPYRALLQAFVRRLQVETTDTDTPVETTRRPSDYLAFRYRQRVAALNLAVQTWPPPKSEVEKAELVDLRLNLFQLYVNDQAYDLARDQLEAIRDIVGAKNFPEPYPTQLENLNKRIETFEQQLDEFSVAQPQQSGPVQRANMATQNGLPGLAIEELLSAEASGIAPAVIRATLLDLYVQTGQPHKAFDLLESVTVNDPSLMTSTGAAGYRQGLVDVLLGFYAETAQFWGRQAIPQVRADMSDKAINTARSMLLGQAPTATTLALDVAGFPGSVGLIELQSNWEAQLGLALLEQGVIQDEVDDQGLTVREGARTHLKRALEADPSHPLKPLIEYYLDRIAEQAPAPKQEAGVG